MTDTITTQNIDFSSWNTLYITLHNDNDNYEYCVQTMTICRYFQSTR